MKAITLKQPWATLVARGIKTIETRTWSTPYRGRLAIHAGKSIDWDVMDRLADGGEIRKEAHKLTGGIIAVATLADVVEMTREHAKKACCEPYAGAMAWILTDVKPLAGIVRMRGALGVWDADFEDGGTDEQEPAPV